MKVNKGGMLFDSQRDRDIFLELLREVNVSELRPEIMSEAIMMLKSIKEGVMGA